MIVEGKYISLEEWEPPGESYKRILKEGWLSFSEYNSNAPEDTLVEGYRIFYQENDRYYSPFVVGGIHDVGRDPAKEQHIGEIIQSPTANGYYYFQSKDVAQNYLAALIIRTHRDMLSDSTFRPQGTFQLHRVEGIAAGPSVYRDEGDRMKEMYTYKEPLITINLSELYPK